MGSLCDRWLIPAARGMWPNPLAHGVRGAYREWSPRAQCGTLRARRTTLPRTPRHGRHVSESSENSGAEAAGFTLIVVESRVEWRFSTAPDPSGLVLVSSAAYERARGLLWRVALVIHCHQRADRSFVFRRRQVPLCARCLGLLFGVTLVPLYCTDPRLSTALIVVMLLDGGTQALHLRESRNWLRFLTGIGFSLGCGGWLVKAFHYLWNT